MIALKPTTKDNNCLRFILKSLQHLPVIPGLTTHRSARLPASFCTMASNRTVEIYEQLRKTQLTDPTPSLSFIFDNVMRVMSGGDTELLLSDDLCIIDDQYLWCESGQLYLKIKNTDDIRRQWCSDYNLVITPCLLEDLEFSLIPQSLISYTLG